MAVTTKTPPKRQSEITGETTAEEVLWRREYNRNDYEELVREVKDGKEMLKLIGHFYHNKYFYTITVEVPSEGKYYDYDTLKISVVYEKKLTLSPEIYGEIHVTLLPISPDEMEHIKELMMENGIVDTLKHIISAFSTFDENLVRLHDLISWLFYEKDLILKKQ